MPIDIFRWMITPIGTGVATWLADFFSVVAVVLSLIAIHRTNVLASEQAARDERNRLRRVTDFVDAAIGLLAEIEEALTSLSATLRSSTVRKVYAEAPQATQLPIQILVYIEGIEGLRMAVPLDAKMATSLSLAKYALTALSRDLPALGSALFESVADRLEVVARTLSSEPQTIAIIGNDAAKRLSASRQKLHSA